MPLYAYKCTKCEYSCKLFHSTDENAGKCPNCSSDTFKKDLSQPSSIKIASAKDTASKRVEKFIEESRESLREQMAEARKEIEK